MLAWQKGKIIEIKQVAPTTRSFFIETTETISFDFEPGQFITLDLPIHTQKNRRWRSYSISSSPNKTNIIELVIVYLEGGAGSNFLFNETKVGDEITFRGPLGKFVLPSTLDKDLYLICTGTGVAPFRSMIHHIQQHQISFKNIYLIFGCRTFDYALYKDEFIELQSQLPNFHYLPCFSRENEIPDWGKKGYVHDAYLEILNSKKSNSHLPEAYFYLCGWKNMIDEAQKRLMDLGYVKKDIHYELYG
ncbi:MAG: oxidoreductase [Chitinophagaceae bacterium]|nr:oxidoreductase [Chitinophagaceae bacterium]